MSMPKDIILSPHVFARKSVSNKIFNINSLKWFIYRTFVERYIKSLNEKNIVYKKFVIMNLKNFLFPYKTNYKTAYENYKHKYEFLKSIKG